MIKLLRSAFVSTQTQLWLMVACPELVQRTQTSLSAMKGLHSKSGRCDTDVLWCLRLLMYVRYGVSSHLCCTHLQVFVSPGDTVAKGDTLITVEGMKMEVSRDAS